MGATAEIALVCPGACEATHQEGLLPRSQVKSRPCPETLIIPELDYPGMLNISLSMHTHNNPETGLPVAI